MEKSVSTRNLYDFTNGINFYVREVGLPLHLHRAMAYNNPFLIHHAAFLNNEASKQIHKEHDNFIDDFFTAMRTYQIEYDAENPIAKLPACFSREYLNLVDSFVILRDPNLNEIEVNIIRKSNKLYFGKGWSNLKSVYDLSFGAWITFGYVNPKFLTIRITARWGLEIKYPTHSPPLKRLLDRSGLDDHSPPRDLKPSMNIYVPCTSFVRTFVKQVTKYDMDSGVLTLPWNDFGEHVFTFACSELVMVDCLGDHYHCKVTIGVDVERQHICKISGGWIDLCTVHGVVEGTRVGFCALHSASDHVMYVTAYPQMGIQTMLSYPLSDGSEVPLYVSQHYFLA